MTSPTRTEEGAGDVASAADSPSARVSTWALESLVANMMGSFFVFKIRSSMSVLKTTEHIMFSRLNQDLIVEVEE